MSLILILMAATALDLGTASDRFNSCVMSHTDRFATAKEAADVTVDAAVAACLAERAELRQSIKAFHSSNAALTKAQAERLEEDGYDLAVSSTRDRALVRIMNQRSSRASN